MRPKTRLSLDDRALSHSSGRLWDTPIFEAVNNTQVCPRCGMSGVGVDAMRRVAM
jgi:hypothetical protein